VNGLQKEPSKPLNEREPFSGYKSRVKSYHPSTMLAHILFASLVIAAPAYETPCSTTVEVAPAVATEPCTTTEEVAPAATAIETPCTTEAVAPVATETPCSEAVAPVATETPTPSPTGYKDEVAPVATEGIYSGAESFSASVMGGLLAIVLAL
jgi:hypothetical protein